MKIVVTGALGHIGSRLIRELPTHFPNVEIVMLDNLSTQRYCSLFNITDDARYRFIEADVLKTELAPIFDGADVVVHLAAITNASGSYENQDQVEQVNFIGTQKVGQACLETGSAMLNLSTTSVYGSDRKVMEETCPLAELKPQSPYAQSKLNGEQYLQSIGDKQGLRYVICRFGTIFGASIGMRFHTAINKFCWQAVNRQPITVWETAMYQRRPYLDLMDAVNALMFIINKELFNRQIYNVLTVNTTVSEILKTISTYVPDITVDYVRSPAMNELSYEVSTQQFEALGFKFSGDLEKSIRSILELLGGLHPE